MSQADPSHLEGHASPFLRLILRFLPILSRSPLRHHYSITTTGSSLSIPLIYALFSSFLFLFLMIVKILSGNWTKFPAGAGPGGARPTNVFVCLCVKPPRSSMLLIFGNIAAYIPTQTQDFAI